MARSRDITSCVAVAAGRGFARAVHILSEVNELVLLAIATAVRVKVTRTVNPVLVLRQIRGFAADFASAMPIYARRAMPVAMTLLCHSACVTYFEPKPLQTVLMDLIRMRRSSQIEK
jgi:hypothetical protein